MKKLYLDIDGVLMTKKGNKPAKHLLDFLKFATSNFDCYWLTTHCQGDAESTVNYLKLRMPEEVFPYLDKIKATNWNTLKTEAIDFSSPFLWFDDDLFDKEREELVKHNTLENWVEVDLRKNQHFLEDFIKRDNRLS